MLQQVSACGWDLYESSHVFLLRPRIFLLVLVHLWLVFSAMIHNGDGIRQQEISFNREKTCQFQRACRQRPAVRHIGNALNDSNVGLMPETLTGDLALVSYVFGSTIPF